MPYQCLLHQIMQLRLDVPLRLELMPYDAPEPIVLVMRTYRPELDPLIGIWFKI